MTITIELPAEVEKKLRAQMPNLEAQAKQACALALFRGAYLSHAELAQVLGLDRVETDALLKQQSIFEGSLDFDDLEADRLTLERVLSRGH